MQKLLISSLSLALLCVSGQAVSAIHFGVSGSVATNNLGLEVHRSQAGKASVGADLGRFFRLSLSGQTKYLHEEGHKNVSDDEDSMELREYTANVRQYGISLDLIAVLYAGDLFTPFVFVGAARKGYKLRSETEGEDPVKTAGWFGPVPNLGGGLAISLNRNFSLKITTTVSQGVRVNPADTEDVSLVRDVQTDLGISYKFH